MKNNLELAHWAVEQARRFGADEVGVDISSETSTRVQVRDKKVEELQDSLKNNLSISIFRDHRASSHSTNDLRRDSLVAFIEEAVAMTGYLQQDPFRSLPDPKYYEGALSVDLKLVDDTAKLDASTRVRRAKAVESAALSQSDKIISTTATFSDSEQHTTKLRSNGFEGETSRTTFTAVAEVTVDDGTGGRPEAWYEARHTHLSEMPTGDKVGIEAARRALQRIGQRKIGSGKFDLIVENRSVARILYPMFAAMCGSALQQKRSFLEGKLGERIGSDVLTVIDDPFIPMGLSSRLFDNEGMAARKLTVIDKGVLSRYFIDWYYGCKLDMPPTTAWPSNVVLQPGERDLVTMIKSVAKGILVTEFIGGNSNDATGDFSLGISGMYIENGSLQHPINEMNISGNLNDFWNNLVEAGNDVYLYGMRTPSLHFTDIQFSGL